MAETRVQFEADKARLAGIIRVPDDVVGGERRPAFVVLHGFGSNMTAGNVMKPCALLEKLGYITLRFDMRGCGDSEGIRGRLIPLEQIADTRSAISTLERHPQVDPSRIALIGSSYGAAIAVYAAAMDSRVCAVISCSGWGNGRRKFQAQHATPEAWQKFTAMLDAGKRQLEETGEHLMVPRYDIVPIPESLRGHLAESSILSFTADTAQTMFDFSPEDVIGKIAPRPVLLLHSASDSVTPTEQSVEMFIRAGQPTDLHVFAETDHFMFAESNTRVRAVVLDWLARYCPLSPT